MSHSSLVMDESTIDDACLEVLLVTVIRCIVVIFMFSFDQLRGVLVKKTG